MAQSLERRIADIMGYEYCIFFPRARDALRYYNNLFGDFVVPSNVCPVLQSLSDGIVPVNPATGLAKDVPVQLYGYRQIVRGANLELDPLMTGAMGEPFANYSIISFGRNKTIELGAGGAFLTNESGHFAHYGLPPIVEEQLERELDSLWDNIRAKWMLANHWDKHLGDSLIRIPQEQVIPWRVMRRVPDGKRDVLVRALRGAGFSAGTNYPPLPGIVHPDAMSWGNEVLNLWGACTDIPAASEIIKRIMDK